MATGFNLPPGGQTPGAFEPRQPSEPHVLYVRGDEPTAGLPPAITERVLRIREIADARHRALPETTERQAVNQARGDAQRRLDRLLEHPHAGGFGLDPATDMRVIMQRRVLADATMAAERLDARYQAAREEFQVAARTRSAIDACLRNRRHGTAFAEYVAEPPRPSKGETILDACRFASLRKRTLPAEPRPRTSGRDRRAFGAGAECVDVDRARARRNHLAGAVAAIDGDERQH